MHSHDSANSNSRAVLPTAAALLRPEHVALTGDDDDALGCEAMHPLTWLPSPAATTAGGVPPARA